MVARSKLPPTLGKNCRLNISSPFRIQQQRDVGREKSLKLFVYKCFPIQCHRQRIYRQRKTPSRAVNLSKINPFFTLKVSADDEWKKKINKKKKEKGRIIFTRMFLYLSSLMTFSKITHDPSSSTLNPFFVIRTFSPLGVEKFCRKSSNEVRLKRGLAGLL